MDASGGTQMGFPLEGLDGYHDVHAADCRPAELISTAVPRTGSPALPIKGGGRARADQQRATGGDGDVDGDDVDADLAVVGLEEMLLRASPKFTEPFNLAQITRNISVGRAARKEMDEGSLGGVDSGTGGGGLSESGSVGMGAYNAEIDRQRASLQSLDDDVGEECKMNREVAAIIMERLENSRKALEGIVRLLSALSTAESAYASAMAAACKVRLSFEADDEEMKAAGADLMRLPSVIAQTHRPLHESLSRLSQDVGELHEAYSAACRTVEAEACAAQRSIDAARRALSAAFDDHVAACCSFDTVLSQRSKGRPAKGPEQDPWATEGLLVQEHKALQRWQDKERAVLKSAFGQVTALEQRRLSVVTQAMTSTVHGYRAALLPLQHDLTTMTAALVAIKPDDKLSKLREMATTARSTAEAMAARQAECIHSVCQELFCSPEIVRQGEMQHWDVPSARWRKCHFVLTRAGYLHWFSGIDDVRPLDGGLALCRCAFEAGKAPRFNIVETAKGGGWLGAMRSRRMEFQASSVEECCEWAIAIREAIAVATGKQLAFEDS